MRCDNLRAIGRKLHGARLGLRPTRGFHVYACERGGVLRKLRAKLGVLPQMSDDVVGLTLEAGMYELSVDFSDNIARGTSARHYQRDDFAKPTYCRPRIDANE